MERSKIYYLLSAYLSGKINKQDNKEMHQILRKTSNEDMGQVLQELWMDYEPSISYDKEVKSIYKQIERKINRQKTKSIIFSFISKAAVFLLPVMMSVCGYLIYERNHHTNPTNSLSVHANSGQMADVVLPDGTKVTLNSESQIEYNIDEKNKKRLVKLEGEAHFQVNKDKERPFIISTHYFDVEALGTTFNVMSYESEEILETTLVEGSIKITTTKLGHNKAIYVKPNQKALYNKRTGDLQLVNADNFTEIAWTKGILAFHSEPLKSIKNELERKYNVTINLDFNDLEDDRFTGFFNNQSLAEILENLRFHYGFDYKIDKNKVEIFQKKKVQ